MNTRITSKDVYLFEIKYAKVAEPETLPLTIDNKAKYRHIKKIDLERDFAAGVCQSLETGDTFSHVGTFDPAL
jgi:hypothetical protein